MFYALLINNSNNYNYNNNHNQLESSPGETVAVNNWSNAKHCHALVLENCQAKAGIASARMHGCCCYCCVRLLLSLLLLSLLILVVDAYSPQSLMSMAVCRVLRIERVAGWCIASASHSNVLASVVYAVAYRDGFVVGRMCCAVCVHVCMLPLTCSA
jgi:hypothetical protein